MKKIIFTICSIAFVCCAVIMSCTKDDNSITHVGYASQSGYGGGNNPNPNGLPYVPPVTTTTTAPTNTTTPNTSGSISINGSATSLNDQGTTAFGNYEILGVPASGSAASPQLSIAFSTTSAPTSGAYTIISGVPTTGQCQFNFTDANGNSGGASSGSVSITTGSSNSCSFTNIICTCGTNTYTVSGTLHY